MKRKVKAERRGEEGKERSRKVKRRGKMKERIKGEERRGGKEVPWENKGRRGTRKRYSKRNYALLRVS